MRKRIVWGSALLAAILVAAPRGFAQNYHDSVVILLDGSGSMSQRMGGVSDSRINVAKSALKTCFRRFPRARTWACWSSQRTQRSLGLSFERQG